MDEQIVTPELQLQKQERALLEERIAVQDEIQVEVSENASADA